jgi:hypothetical protein
VIGGIELAPALLLVETGFDLLQQLRFRALHESDEMAGGVGFITASNGVKNGVSWQVRRLNAPLCAGIEACCRVTQRF